MPNPGEAFTMERTWLDGPAGRLEALLAYPDDAAPSLGVLINGPHPLLGGDLDNNLVRALLTGLASHGMLALGYNYSGVGHSDGGPADWPDAIARFWDDGTIPIEQAWIEDAKAAQRSLTSMLDGSCVVIGYSFGCWVSSYCMSGGIAERGCADLPNSPRAPSTAILISPNPMKHDFSALASGNVPLVVIGSDNDFTCTPDQLRQWFDTLRPPMELHLLHAGDHFFRGQEDSVVQCVLSAVLGLAVAPPRDSSAAPTDTPESALRPPQHPTTQRAAP